MVSHEPGPGWPWILMPPHPTWTLPTPPAASWDVQGDSSTKEERAFSGLPDFTFKLFE